MVEVYPRIIRDPDLCTGCKLCEIVCSFRHEGGFQPSMARIKIQSRGEGKTPIPFVCQHCEHPECSLVCPTGARKKDRKTGLVAFENELCVGCKMCLLSCSRAGLIFDQENGRFSVCDLCEDEPACVEACTHGALALRDIRPLREGLKDKDDLLSPGLAACQGCAGEWVMRFTVKILGPNTVMGLPPCCMSASGVVGFGTNTGAKIPITFTHLGNAAAMMAGVKYHFQRQHRDVNVVAFAGDGGTADIGLQALSAAGERGDNIIYICYDNEAYMNTGIQRSGTTPQGCWTTTTPVGQVSRGKRQASKNLPLIMLAHNLPYMATASSAYPDDFMAKLEKAKKVKDGLSYIHVLSPCPIGWRFPSEDTMKVARMAVETNVFPLWEAHDGKLRFTRKVEFPKPIETYTKMMGRYSHLTREEIGDMQKAVNKHYEKLLALMSH